MNKTKLFYPFAISIFALTALFLPALASAAKPTDLPEAPGTYAVPGNSKLKLRVFVYHAKNGAKPGPSPAPVWVCGLTDPSSSTVDGYTGWKLPSTWTYRLNTGSVPGAISQSEFTILANNSLNTWKATDAGSVTFTQGANTSVNKAASDSQNIVSWGRTSGSALATTYTWYYPSTGIVAESDIILNKHFAWEWSDSNSCAWQNYYDAQSILTHELGHWLGLDDNYLSTFTDNTMYGYGSATEVKKNTLADGDKSAVNSLY